jgi:hypothetical protein
MQSITDDRRVVRGARVGKIATLVGLGFLLGGLVISLALQESPLLWLSFACLIAGLVISSVGTMNMNRWVREPRADQALAQGLKGYDDRYRLYNYLLPAPHVLLSPIGLYVLTALGQDGTVRYEGGKFRRDFSLGRVLRFMADEGLGRPFAVGDSEIKALQQFLEEHEVGEGVEIQNVLVFYNPRAQLSVSDLPRPVVDPKGLKRALRKQAGDKLAGNQYRQLKDLFEGTAS